MKAIRLAGVVSSVEAAVMVGLVGVMAVLFSQPWLFPSLGPTAYLLAVYPDLATSRRYNCLAGHVVGLASGFAAVAVFNAWDAPLVPLHDASWSRVGAAALAVGLTVMLNHLLKSGHPPAAATTLLVALGTFHTAWGAALVVIGVVLLLVFAEALKRGTRLFGRITNRRSRE